MGEIKIDSIWKRFSSLAHKRYVRPTEASELLEIDVEEVLFLAGAAGAICQLPRIILLSVQKMEEYMKHICKVPGTGKYVQKKFARIGEGTIIYSIGRHRFIEMARAAGAVYKMGEEKGGTVLVNLEIFDEYMEQFRTAPVAMKNPLWKGEEE